MNEQQQANKIKKQNAKAQEIQRGARDIEKGMKLVKTFGGPKGAAIAKGFETANKFTGGNLYKGMAALNRFSPQARAIQAAAGMLSNGLSGSKSESSKKSEFEKDANDIEKDEQEKEKGTGQFVGRVPLPVKLVVVFGIIPAFSFLMLFVGVITNYVADEKAFGVFAGKVAGGKDVDDFRDEIGAGMGGPTYDEFLSRYDNLGNIYEYFDCESEEECLERNEVKFFIKVNDISTRYKKIYGITLDWELLMATVFSMDLDVDDTYEKFLNEYDEDDVEDYDKLMNLDWEYDYKHIDGYSYLNGSDYRYDLQILAKNMVRKTTTQTCSITTTDEEGNTHVEITKKQVDIDIEDKYLKPGEEYYLECDSGESYHITSDYSLDLDKYDVFLLEYIEHKFFLESIGMDPITGETDMTPSEASGDYIFPLPEGATSCRTSAYGPRIHPITGKKQNHSGDDYPAAAGTPVYAVKDGVVSSAGYGYNGGKGNYVTLDHGNGISSVYMHASELYVKTGDKVSQGEVIMAVGTTGSSTGNHLHITFYKNSVTDNPANYIGALPMCR